MRNAPNADYHPGVGSPLIDAAPLSSALLAVVPTDFAGSSRLQGATFDIGAYEGSSTVVVIAANYDFADPEQWDSGGAGDGSGWDADGERELLRRDEALLNTVGLNNGAASTAVSLDTTVGHSLTAVYGGDGNYPGEHVDGNCGGPSCGCTGSRLRSCLFPTPVVPVTYPGRAGACVPSLLHRRR